MASDASGRREPEFAEILIQKANQYANQAVGLQSWVASSGSKTNSLSAL
jgi:hypothetical protein